MSHWRKRVGDRLDMLLAETLRIVEDIGALKKNDQGRAITQDCGAGEPHLFAGKAFCNAAVRLLQVAKTVASGQMWLVPQGFGRIGSL
jgi:hypothetical protein